MRATAGRLTTPLTTAALMLLAHAGALCLLGMALVPRDAQIPSHYSVPIGIDGWDRAWSMFGFFVTCSAVLALLVPLLAIPRVRRHPMIGGHPAALLPAMALWNAIWTAFIVIGASSVDRGVLASCLTIPLYVIGILGVGRYLFSVRNIPVNR